MVQLDPVALLAPAAALPATPTASASSGTASVASSPQGAPGTAVVVRKRRRAARIDLDDRISSASKNMKLAQKQMGKARAEARNERRKKQRLVRKAATLSTEDLHRMAELKRGGLWDPAAGLPAPPAGRADTAPPDDPPTAAVGVAVASGAGSSAAPAPSNQNTEQELIAMSPDGEVEESQAEDDDAVARDI